MIQAGVLAEITAEDDEPVTDGMLLDEEHYLNLLDRLPSDNALLDDSDPNKFIAKMGAEAIYDLLCRLDLDSLSYQLRDKANTDTSQQRKAEALKRLHSSFHTQVNVWKSPVIS